MAKGGIGNVANDKSVNVSTRGTVDVLSVEIVDASGNQVAGTQGFPTFPATGLVPKVYDFISYASTTLTDIYTYKSGGVLGTTVATLTVTWTTSAKTVLSTVART